PATAILIRVDGRTPSQVCSEPEAADRTSNHRHVGGSTEQSGQPVLVVCLCSLSVGFCVFRLFVVVALICKGHSPCARHIAHVRVNTKTRKQSVVTDVCVQESEGAVHEAVLSEDGSTLLMKSEMVIQASLVDGICLCVCVCVC